MRTKSLLVSLVALSSLSMAVYSGCASTTPSLPEQANAPRLAARVMTPSGAKAVPQGAIKLGADPRFAVRLDAERAAHVYLVRCSQGTCTADATERMTKVGVPLLLDGPGGWLTMAQAPSEELRVVASAEPLSQVQLDRFKQAMATREPETTTPDKRGLEEETSRRHSDAVAMLTLVLRR